MHFHTDGNYSFPEDFNGPLIAAALTVEFIGALVANGIVLIATLIQYKSLKVLSTMLFTSLIIIHLIISVLFILLWIISAASEEWIYGTTIEQKIAACTFHGCVLNYGIWIIFGTITAMSVDHCIFIVKPNFYKRFMKPKVTLTLIALIWVVALILDTAPLYGFGEVAYEEYGACVPRFEGEITYVVITMTLVIMQICIIIVTSTWIYCFTHKFIQEHSQLADDVYVSRNRRLVGIFCAMLIG
ncbi:PREDICTED: probable G-protein coupled receptor 101 [Amphimedon queenslandica]|uniref:G-protein coupled receptors family 1 profile domain-containing protein n=1 Tax=Amphimedon queenslandica TaxID=400682 RepID=A0A1X7TT91_AMPQE|nr:PREDICTED: probable G-protein coupled receptor 101 [Amphimedon queenslandica]|eukprot:XP_011406887.1 PREDICTED: probable G-protein coupled receptor 101 [Amphimedon queenslandica]